MITKTGIHVDLDSTFTNPLVYEENGQVNHVVADNLTPETRYYTRAYVVSDGTTVYSGNTKSFTTEAQVQNDYFGFTNRSSSNSATLRLVFNDNEQSGAIPSIQLEYSLDNGSTWTNLTWQTVSSNQINTLSDVIIVPPSVKVLFRGTNNTFSTAMQFYTFGVESGPCAFDVSGNIMSLLDPTMTRTNLTGDYCFTKLFRYMSDLIDASGLLLPATTVPSHSYSGMFLRCTSLVSAPALPATTLGANAYDMMFSECSSLVNAPALPATTVSSYSYFRMFYACSSLVNAPALPATNLGIMCYKELFANCTSLVNPPALPATTLAQGCYEYMFSNTAIVNPPALPATTLAPYCYSGMLSECASLVSAPALPATVIFDHCYSNLFKNSPLINRVEINLSGNTSQYNALDNWLYGCASTGDVFNNGNAVIPIRSASGVPTGWNLHVDYLCFTANQANSTIGLRSGTPNIEISTDGSTWSTWDLSTITLSNVGDKVYMRGTNSTLNGTRFVFTGSIAGSGDMMTILGYANTVTGSNTSTTNIPDRCFYETFSNNQTTLTSAPYLSATTTTNSYNCAYMYKNCTGLTDIPKFPRITMTWNGLCAFEGMYMGCTGLTGTLDLSYMTEPYAFTCETDSIFSGTNYTRLDLTGITDLTDRSYMFKRAFKDMPELRSADMRNCTSISGSYTLEDMFRNDSKLSEIIMGVTEYVSINRTYLSWVRDVSSIGTFYNLGNANFPTNSVNGIPSGWTVRYYYGINYFYIKNLYNGGNTVTVTKNGNPSTGSDLAYSFDKETWTTVTYTNNLCSIALSEQNQKLYFRSSTGLNESATDYYKFSATQNHAVGGDVRKLIDYDDDTIYSIPAYEFIKLFENDVNLSDASDLSFIGITTVGVSSLNSMFYGCTSLVNVPALPATTLAASCYDSLFYRCTSLVSAPVLTATTLAPACYRRIFASCSSLVNAPVLPATTLTEGCYYEAFADCVSLVNAPALPATTLAEDCYNGLFKNCSSLVKAPKLFATALALNSYDSLFYGCSLIDEVTVYIQTWNANNADNWLYGCASSGVVYDMNDAAIPTNTYSGVPVNWTAETPHYTELAYIHKDVLVNEYRMNDPWDLNYIVTNITPTENMSWRVKGKWKGYSQGCITAGSIGTNTYNPGGDPSSRWGIFFYNPLYYDIFTNYRNSAGSLTPNTDYDFTVSNYALYDNINDYEVFNQGHYTGLPSNMAPIHADVGCWWLKSLEIFDENGDTVFDGVAAEYNGDYGLWDTVTNQFFTNTHITIVGEQ